MPSSLQKRLAAAGHPSPHDAATAVWNQPGRGFDILWRPTTTCIPPDDDGIVVESHMLFEKELQFFIAHQDELVAKYMNQVLVLRAERVEGVYKTLLEAYLDARSKFEDGTFMIQPCRPGPDAYTVTLASLNW